MYSVMASLSTLKISLLQNFGTVKREVAEALAIGEYEKYDAHRREIEAADVDGLSKEIEELKK